MSYAVFVTFRIRPQERANFIAAMAEQARLSLANEPGCQVFEVWISEEDENTIELYEIYDDRQAFDEHLASSHFLKFNSSTAEMVTEKRVSTSHNRIT